MKKLFLAALLSIFTLGAFAQDGMKFYDGDFASLLTKAKAENKMIFMDAYAVWCGPCKYMASDVFPTKEAGEYFNANFINYKVDMEKGEGPTLAKKYGVKAYPTFLILDGDGKELGKIVGGAETAEFIKKVKGEVAKINKGK